MRKLIENEGRRYPDSSPPGATMAPARTGRPSRRDSPASPAPAKSISTIPISRPAVHGADQRRPSRIAGAGRGDFGRGAAAGRNQCGQDVYARLSAESGGPGAKPAARDGMSSRAEPRSRACAACVASPPARASPSSRPAKPTSKGDGGYMLSNDDERKVVLGGEPRPYTATLDEIEAFLDGAEATRGDIGRLARAWASGSWAGPSIRLPAP